MTEVREGRVLSAYRFYRLPEFKALCEAAGIAYGMPTVGMVIEIPAEPEELVKVTHTYRCKRVESDAPIDTTDVHNKQRRTYAPREGL